MAKPSVQPLPTTHDEQVPAPNPEIGAASVNTGSNIPVPADGEGKAPTHESGTWLTMFLRPAMIPCPACGDVPIMQKIAVEIVQTSVQQPGAAMTLGETVQPCVELKVPAPTDAETAETVSYIHWRNPLAQLKVPAPKDI